MFLKLSDPHFNSLVDKKKKKINVEFMYLSFFFIIFYLFQPNKENSFFPSTFSSSQNLFSKTNIVYNLPHHFMLVEKKEFYFYYRLYKMMWLRIVIIIVGYLLKMYINLRTSLLLSLFYVFPSLSLLLIYNSIVWNEFSLLLIRINSFWISIIYILFD